MLETTTELKGRYESAFRRYSVQTTKLREMRACLPASNGSVHMHALHEQCQAQDKAERDYRSVRLQYVRRLLALGTGD
jgi:hypothetical protein